MAKGEADAREQEIAIAPWYICSTNKTSFTLYLITYAANTLNGRVLAPTSAQTNPLAPLPAHRHLNMQSSASIVTVQVLSVRTLVMKSKIRTCEAYPIDSSYPHLLCGFLASVQFTRADRLQLELLALGHGSLQANS